MRALPACVFAALAPAALAAGLDCGAEAPLSTPVRLEYEVTASRSVLTLSGDAVVTFARRGDAYEMESRQRALGVVEARQTSVGTVGGHGLVPQRFTQQSSRRPARGVEFDWAAQRVSFTQSGESAPTRPQMQDRLSLLLQIGWRQRAEQQATTIELPVAGQRGASTYLFAARGAEAVAVPAGRFEALRYERHRDDGDDALEVWLAPALCSLPVRLRFTDDNGLVVEQRLRAVRALAP